MIDNLSPEVPHRKSPSSSIPLQSSSIFIECPRSSRRRYINQNASIHLCGRREILSHKHAVVSIYCSVLVAHLGLRERGDERNRQTLRLIGWQTNRHTHMQTDRHNQWKRQTERARKTQRENGRQKDGERWREKESQTDRQRWETDIQKQRDTQRDGGIETEKQRQRNRDRQRKTERDREFYLETERQRVGEWERQRERKGRESGSVFLDRPLRFFGGRPVATFSANTSATPIIM